MEELAAGMSRVGIQDAIMLPSDEELIKMVQPLEKKSEGGNYTTVTGAYRWLVEEGLIPNAHDDDSQLRYQAGDWEIERTKCSYSFIITCRAFLETKAGSLSKADLRVLSANEIPGGL
jgi:hypothetical protein